MSEGQIPVLFSASDLTKIRALVSEKLGKLETWSADWEYLYGLKNYLKAHENKLRDDVKRAVELERQRMVMSCD